VGLISRSSWHCLEVAIEPQLIGRAQLALEASRVRLDHVEQRHAQRVGGVGDVRGRETAEDPTKHGLWAELGIERLVGTAMADVLERGTLAGDHALRNGQLQGGDGGASADSIGRDLIDRRPAELRGVVGVGVRQLDEGMPEMSAAIPSWWPRLP
jgi:hypothetical protein